MVTQQDPLIKKPNTKKLFSVKTIKQILQIIQLHNNTIKTLFETKSHKKLLETQLNNPYYTKLIEPIFENKKQNPKLITLNKNVHNKFKHYLKKIKQHTKNIKKLTIDSKSPFQLTNQIAPLLNINLKKKQKLLKIKNPHKQLKIIFEHILKKYKFKKIKHKLKKRVQNQIDHTQKKYYLNEQIKTIQKKLEQNKNNKTKIKKYTKKLKKLPLSEKTKKINEHELKKTQNNTTDIHQNQHSPQLPQLPTLNTIKQKNQKQIQP